MQYSIINLDARYSYEFKPEHNVYYVYFEGKYINYAYHKQGVEDTAREHMKNTF